VEDFKYLGTSLTNQNSIREEFKSRLNSGMLAIIRCRIFCFAVCYPNIKIKISRTIILPVVWYVCETWSLTMRGKHRLRMFENRVLRRTFRPKRDEVRGNGENYIGRILMFCTPHPMLFGLSNREE
jgi:hypothetical protein